VKVALTPFGAILRRAKCRRFLDTRKSLTVSCTEFAVASPFPNSASKSQPSNTIKKGRVKRA